MKTNANLIKIITTETIGSSSIAKKITSFVFFVFYFVIASILLFKTTDGIPKSVDDAKKYTWISISLSLIWYTFKKTNFNIHISYNSSLLSYIMPLLFAILNILFIFISKDHKPNDIIGYSYVIPWLIIFIGVNMLWRWIILIAEWNTRPFFANEQIFKILMEVIVIIILIFIFETFIPMLVVEKLNFVSLIEAANAQLLFALITSGTLICVYLWLWFYKRKTTKTNKFISLTTNRIMSLWNALLTLGPTLIWFLAYAKIPTINWQKWIYIVTIIFCAILCTLTLIVRNESDVTSKVYLLISNTTLFITIALLFIMSIWANMNLFFGIYFALPVIIYIYILNILVEPELPPTYATGYSVLTYTLFLYLGLIWTMQILFRITDTIMPFSIDKILWVIPMVVITYLEVLTVISTLHTYRSITKESIKIIKYQSKKYQDKLKRKKKGMKYVQ
ncbi:hypothetical protein [Candidatus Mycoplasma mahonii]|uniref:hypothetical protein n=1 Tax=Candidatus Mycoplasma mahonii TaxID=3004105 RepID=UPI0026EFDDF8|nr:hypothetical protein [Candidatus Mycoplasma mahonii]WKX02188.1 hypothetical protein O3I44_02175 [Candidatus Mycoplasma mahonii]